MHAIDICRIEEISYTNHTNRNNSQPKDWFVMYKNDVYNSCEIFFQLRSEKGNDHQFVKKATLFETF